MFQRMCKDLTFNNNKNTDGLNYALEHVVFKGKIDSDDIKRIIYHASVSQKELIACKNIPELLTFLYEKSVERRIPKPEIKLPKWLEKFLGE